MAEDGVVSPLQQAAYERSTLLRTIADLEVMLSNAQQDYAILKEENDNYLSQITLLSRKNDESAAIIDNLTKKMENILLNGQTSPTERISWYRDTVKSNVNSNKSSNDGVNVHSNKSSNDGVYVSNNKTSNDSVNVSSNKTSNDSVNERENYSAGLDLINAARAKASANSSITTQKPSYDADKHAKVPAHSPVKSVATHTTSSDVNSRGSRKAKFALETKIYTASSRPKRKVVRKKPKSAIALRTTHAFLLPDGNVNEQYTFMVPERVVPDTYDNNSVNSGSTASKSLPWERGNHARPSVDHYLNMQVGQRVRPAVDSENIDPIIVPENYHDDLLIRELLSDINSNDYKNLTIHVPHRPSTSASSGSRMKKVQVPLGNIDSYGWGRPTSAYEHSKYENNQYNYYQVHSINKHRSYQERPATVSNPQPSSCDASACFFPGNYPEFA
jgi:hypothetical protein